MKNIYLLLHIVTWDGWTENLQGEGRMVRKRLTPKSDRVTLYAYASRLVSSIVTSKRSLGQIRQPNTNISEILRPSIHGFDDVR